MYMELCPHGDLERIETHYRSLNQPIPEPLIWHIFESLVNVGLPMEQGSVTEAQDGWIQIVHRDIKALNVFLGLHPLPAPTRDNWAAYPTIKLGDYGLAVEISPADIRNPDDLVDEGTSGFQAPEQIAGTGDPGLLTAKTNVFGVGITVMNLMSLNQDVGVYDWSAARKGSRLAEAYPGATAETGDHYSEELIALVKGCVEHAQDDRHSFSYLQDAILGYTGGSSDPQDLANGMRANIIKQTLLLGLTPDRYAIGKKLPTNGEESDVGENFNDDGEAEDDDKGEEDNDNANDDDDEEEDEAGELEEFYDEESDDIV